MGGEVLFQKVRFLFTITIQVIVDHFGELEVLDVGLSELVEARERRQGEFGGRAEQSDSGRGVRQVVAGCERRGRRRRAAEHVERGDAQLDHFNYWSRTELLDLYGYFLDCCRHLVVGTWRGSSDHQENVGELFADCFGEDERVAERQRVPVAHDEEFAQETRDEVQVRRDGLQLGSRELRGLAGQVLDEELGGAL